MKKNGAEKGFGRRKGGGDVKISAINHGRKGGRVKDG